MANYTSAELKLRTLASQDPTLQTDLGTDPRTFRWYDRQLLQNEIGKLLANGACVRVRRVSTIRLYNQGGNMNLCAPRLQIDVMDFQAEKARVVANDIVNFMNTVDLCSLDQFDSPVTQPNQNPCFLLSQTADMIVNPQSPAGPVYVERMDWRVWNREDLSIS